MSADAFHKTVIHVGSGISQNSFLGLESSLSQNSTILSARGWSGTALSVLDTACEPVLPVDSSGIAVPETGMDFSMFERTYRQCTHFDFADLGSFAFRSSAYSALQFLAIGGTVAAGDGREGFPLISIILPSASRSFAFGCLQLTFGDSPAENSCRLTRP